MKYSIRGSLNSSDDLRLIQLVNKYLIYRLDPKKTVNEEGKPIVTFEIWLPSIADKDRLFEDLKGEVNLMGGQIDWHECTHDEEHSQPCVIAEEYGR